MAYGIGNRPINRNYFATIRTNSGASTWEHVRTSMGRKVAYAMIAKHWDGYGKIISFRDEGSSTEYDREGARHSDGVLRVNIWAGFGEMKCM